MGEGDTRELKHWPALTRLCREALQVRRWPRCAYRLYLEFNEELGQGQGLELPSTRLRLPGAGSQEGRAPRAPGAGRYRGWEAGRVGPA